MKRLVPPISFGYFENAASSSSAEHNIIGRWHVFAKHNLQPSIHINNAFTCPHMEWHIGIIVNSFLSTVNTIVLPYDSSKSIAFTKIKGDPPSLSGGGISP
jgi:hypothetical protein